VHMLPESIGSVPVRPGKAAPSARGGGLVPRPHPPLTSLAEGKVSTAARADQGLPNDLG